MLSENEILQNINIVKENSKRVKEEPKIEELNDVFIPNICSVQVYKVPLLLHRCILPDPL